MTRFPSPIDVVIDELVIRGLDAGQARVAVAAFEARLAELAANPEAADVPARVENRRHLRPVDVETSSGNAIGQGVAGAVWGFLAGERR